MKRISENTARDILLQIWDSLDDPYAFWPDLEQFRRGLEVEQEHLRTLNAIYLDLAGEVPSLDVTLLDIGSIAWDHLEEIPDYYTRLDKMEREAKRKR